MSFQSENRNITQKNDLLANKKIVWTLISLAVIWISTIIVSLFSPDLISGSQQEHLPLVGWTAWIWALLATAIVIRMVRERINYQLHYILSVSIIAIWIGVMLVSVFASPFVTGSDPTSLPIASIGAPLIGSLFTVMVWFLAKPPSN
ncbi:MAG: hypothetical protein HeimC3_03330 [Candidatus Heimdallarchaeota archaeon LC_3]|nr:MAG: hypothetical protein HeimC3_03330 [Candidatus Heimdallarchaeota archaeon LC_3]